MHSPYMNSNCTTSFCYYNLENPNSNPNSMRQQSMTAKGSCYRHTTDNLEKPVCFNSRVNLENSKRSSKKDRHSKIHTARGPRDRRMRLSLDVAKKFFKLQDMLGFDKASNTIEWLIMKSTPAIQDLVSQQLTQNISVPVSVPISVSVSNSPSSASECEVLDDRSTPTKDKAKFNSKEKKKVETERKRVYIDHSFAKETREKARARARKRTSEKRKNKLGYVGETCVQYSKLVRPTMCEVMDQNTNRFGSSIPSVGNQVQLADETEYPSSFFQFKQGIVGDNSAMMSSNWSQSFMGLNSHDQHQFSEFQILGKPWEGINN